MKLDPATIAHYAAGAGFVGAELPTAVAIAWVASGGLDHYDFAPGSPGVGRYVGLWGIDTDRWPEYAPGDLVAPDGAARAAHDLTRRLDGFAWSPVWCSGSDRPWRDLAATATTMHPFRETEHAPVLSAHLGEYHRQWRERALARVPRR